MQPEHILAAPSHPDPYPWYAELAAGPPLVFDAARGFWIAASAAAVQQVMSSPACRVRPVAEPVPDAIAGSPAGEVFARLVRMNDGPISHAMPRFVLHRLLADADLAAIRRRAADIARVDPLQRASLSGWTTTVPVMVVADWLGFAGSELPQVAAWVGDFVACLSPASSAAQLATASEAAGALIERLAVLLDDAPARPGSTLAPVQSLADRAGWHDRQALLANLAGLLSQSFEATAGLLGNSVVALARAPGLLDAARADATLWSALVQDTSRLDPAVHNTRRFVAEAVTLCGQSLDAGDAVLLVLAAAGRDRLLDPLNSDHLPFGHGMHRCPGQAFACTVAAAALQAMWGDARSATPLPVRWTYRPLVNARIPVFAD